jgi:hypothetical protein
MDLSNNELFQMLLTDTLLINNNNLLSNHNYMYNNYNSIFNNIINNIQNEIENEILNENYNDDTIPPLFHVFPFYNTSVPNSQTVLHQSLYDRNPIKNVVTEEVKNGLSTIKFKYAKDREKNDKCSISMEKFNEEDDIIQLPCNHCFCVEPIVQWLTEESCECPVCRYKFDSIEKNTRRIESDEPMEIDDMEDLPDLIEINNSNFYEEPNIIEISEIESKVEIESESESESENEIELETYNSNIVDISRLINVLFTEDSFIYDPETDIIPPDVD